MDLNFSAPQRKLLFGLLFFVGFIRFISLGLYPLSDTTESRYAEIARLMETTGNWVTPHVDYGVPFWGKPPLSTWLSAISIKLFGANEFAARLPSFLLAIAVLLLIYSLAKHFRGKDYALASSVVLMLSLLYFVNGGAVMTDPALILGTTLSMVGFYRALYMEGRAGRIWGYLFFVGLAIGMLAKGPVGVVLTGVPIFLWLVWQRDWRLVWQRIPWLTGAVLAVVLTFPWYLLAESRTPGFIDYFIIGEHWKRFVEPGWSGDLYGGAHSRPRGTIWAYWLLAAFPWALMVVGGLFRRNDRQKMKALAVDDKPWFRYFLLWSIAPMLFFSMAGNILWTYILPGLPALALLLAGLWVNTDTDHAIAPLLTKVAVGMTALLTVILLVVASGQASFNKCQIELIRAFDQESAGNATLTYIFSRPPSAQFYSAGRAQVVNLFVEGQDALFLDDVIDYIAIQKRFLHHIPEQHMARLELLGEFSDGYSLLVETRVD